MPTITDYLKYANLQMAAEAFLNDPDPGDKNYSGTALKDALVRGNGHASKFTATGATAFADQWEVVDQRANTHTGFSGTLFRNKADPNELVLSFRSTEFIDDAIRDSAATNSLEVFGTGWAWGQMADMEAWYQELTGENGALVGKTYSVTGYSLGGHLATAFNLLRREEAAQGPMPATLDQVVTFNGAGVGVVKGGTLAEVLGDFQMLRGSADAIRDRLGLVTPELASFYGLLQSNLNNGTWTATQAKGELAALSTAAANTDEAVRAGLEAEKAPLYKALADIIALQDERTRIAGFTAGGDGPDANNGPKPVAPGEILAESLDYRLAVYFASQKTSRVISVLSKTPGNPPLANQTDLVGKETSTTPWSAVANSGVHYGANVDLFIEGQPLTRGSFVDTFIRGLTGGEINLLQDQYAENSFADSHSLALLVDSLAVQDALLNLLPEDKRQAAAATLQSVLLQASWRKAESTLGGQGQAEGDVLENVVNALADLFLGPQDAAMRLNGSPEGNTWAKTDETFIGADGRTYSGREALYARLEAIVGSDAYREALGTLRLSVPDSSLATKARTDFAAFAALYSLSPFVLEGEGFAALLADAWGDLHTAWNVDRLAHESGDTEHRDRITDIWLSDRAAFLAEKRRHGASNANPYDPDATEQDGSPRLADVYYEDFASGERIQQGRMEGSAVRGRFFGSAENDTIYGWQNDDRLYGMAGDDTLNGGAGKDYLEGGAGNDTYIIGDGLDTIVDRDGRIVVGSGDPLIGSPERAQVLIPGLSADGSATWKDGNRDDIAYVLREDKQTPGVRNLGIYRKTASGYEQIAEIRNYRPGDLGLDFQTQKKVALGIAGDANPFTAGGAGEQQTTGTGLAENRSRTIRAFLNAPAKAGDVLRLTLAGGPGAAFAIVTGDETVSFENGAIELTLRPGQTEIAFALLNNGDLDADAALTLTAAHVAADPDAEAAEAATLAVNFDASEEPEPGDPQTTRSIVGDLAPVDFEPEPGVQARTDELGNLITDPEQPEPGRADTLYDSAGNDHIQSGDGDDRVYATLVGGAGNDVLAGGSGSDLLIGGAGNDRLFGDSDQVADEFHGNDTLDGGAGDDILVGERGADRLYGGDGDDLLVGDGNDKTEACNDDEWRQSA